MFENNFQPILRDNFPCAPGLFDWAKWACLPVHYVRWLLMDYKLMLLPAAHFCPTSQGASWRQNGWWPVGQNVHDIVRLCLRATVVNASVSSGAIRCCLFLSALAAAGWEISDLQDARRRLKVMPYHIGRVKRSGYCLVEHQCGRHYKFSLSFFNLKG